MSPLEFIFAIGEMVFAKWNPYGLRQRGEAFHMMVFAPIRFTESIDVEEIWRTKTAFCGRSAGQKKPPSPLIQLAAVRKGISSGGVWIKPRMVCWGKYKPAAKGSYRFLTPYVSTTWVVAYSRQCSGGAFQHAIRRAELHLGFPNSLTRKSPRTWYATCARVGPYALRMSAI